MTTEVFKGEWSGNEPLSRLFHEIPKKIYQSNSNWIPEVANIVDYMFSQHNQYFSVGSVWLDIRESARFAGFYSPIQVVNGKNAAYFGYWETVNDTQLNKEIFQEFESWAKAKGAEVVYGPINFSTYGMYRIRVDSFDAPQFIGEPINPKYYPNILSDLGYAESQLYATSNMRNLRSFEEEHINVVSSLEPELLKSFVIKKVTKEYWLKNIEELYELSLEIFKNNFAYVPVSLDDFRKVCGESFASKICEYSSVVAESKDGRIAGMMLNFPDYSPLVNQASNHGLLPDAVSFKDHFQLLEKPMLLAKTAGVSNDFRGMHLYTYLFSKSMLNGMEVYEHALGCLFILDNPSRKVSDRMTGDLRHYALYSKEL